MDLLFLGTAPGFSQINKSHSSLWINNKNSAYLLDCGEGTYQNILRYSLDISKLQGVIITHFHPDHVSGIFMLLQNMHILQRKETLELYLPERKEQFREILNFFYLFKDRFNFQLRLKNLRDIEKDLGWMKAVENNHLKYLNDYVRKHDLGNRNKSYSIILNSGANSCFISSDIKSLKATIEYKNCDIMIVDGFHPVAKDLLMLSDYRSQKKLDKIILTHGLSKELITISNKEVSEIFELAEDGKKIVF